MGTNTEIYNWAMCRELKILEHSVLNGMSFSNLSSQGSVFYAKVEVQKKLRARDGKWL